MTNKVLSSVVCDAGPLIHLDELDVVWLLNDFSAVMVPDQVWQEVTRHRASLWETSTVSYQRVKVDISNLPTFRALVRTFSLDLGEQAALSLMQAYPTAVFLTDDAAARLAATTLGLRVHGTIGILLRAIRRQQLNPTQVLEILNHLPTQSSLHIKANLLQEIIDRLQQQPPS